MFKHKNELETSSWFPKMWQQNWESNLINKVNQEMKWHSNKQKQQRLSLEQNYLLLASSYVVSSAGNFTYAHIFYSKNSSKEVFWPKNV